MSGVYVVWNRAEISELYTYNILTIQFQHTLEDGRQSRTVKAAVKRCTVLERDMLCNIVVSKKERAG
jgi:hypothetical protein